MDCSRVPEANIVFGCLLGSDGGMVAITIPSISLGLGAMDIGVSFAILEACEIPSGRG